MDIENGGQPFYRDGVYCICNGEIYNYKQLIKDYNLPVKTNSDCEVLLHLYFERQDFATLLDGVFAFVIREHSFFFKQFFCSGICIYYYFSWPGCYSSVV